MYYILDGHRAVPCDLMTWAKSMEEADPTVARTQFADGTEVSTVFLGLDYNCPPLIFETMVFGGALDREQDRCSTWDEAEAQHASMVERVKATLRRRT